MPKITKREEKISKQIIFLRKIRELKEELFGQFSPALTKETKRKAWAEARDVAVSIGLITNDKDYTYIRDATWPNLRNRTMIKVDKSSKTGEGGGPDAKFDEMDLLILDIIGKESPVIKGIGVPDSMEEQEPAASEDVTDTDAKSEEPLTMPLAPFDTNEQNTSKGHSKKKVVVRTLSHTKIIEELKIKKLKLEVRKLELEVFQKENELQVSHSDLTRHISSFKDKAQYIVNNLGELIAIQRTDVEEETL